MKIIISEKSSVTKELGKAMGWVQSGAMIKGKFEGEDVIVISAAGHLMGLKDPQEVHPHMSWDDPVSLVPLPTDYTLVPIKDRPGSKSHLQPKARLKVFKDVYEKNKRNVTEIIIATDSDREGEAIGWEIINHLGWKGRIRRAWFAAGVDEKSLKEAMENLRDADVTKSWWRASEARNCSDYGYINLTMGYTFYAGYGKFGRELSQGKGSEGVMSVGRVQTPALGMIVKRELEIKNFIARDHFKVSANFDALGAELFADYLPYVTEDVIANNQDGIYWQPSKVVPKEGEAAPLDTPLFVDEAKVNAFMDRLKQFASQAIITGYKEGSSSQSPDKTYALSGAQSAIVGACGVSAQTAQSILEDLYLKGYLSYARTSKAEIPINYHQPQRRNEMLQATMQIPELSKQAKEVADIHNGKHPNYKPFTPKTYSKKDMEHHGIVPTTKVMTKSEFDTLKPDGKGYTTEHMQKAYVIVCKRYIQALYPPAQYATQEIEVTVPCEDLLKRDVSVFRARGKRVIDLGWKAAFGGSTKESVLPKLEKGDSTPLLEAFKKAATTKPPERYKEEDFPDAMANLARYESDPELRRALAKSEGIGTPATRASIIEIIKKRKYVEVKKGVFYATQKGMDLIEAVPEFLRNASFTAKWEDYLIKLCTLRDDNKAVQMRDAFIKKQRDAVEFLINDMIQKYQNNLGQKIAKAPKEVSPNMIKAIKTICKAKGLNPPANASSDPVVAMTFITEHQDVLRVPSQAQLNLIERIKAEIPEAVIPENYVEDKKVCSEIIEKYKDQLFSKPTPGMVKYMNDLASKCTVEFQVPENAETSTEVCSATIETLKKLTSKPVTEGQLKFIDQIAEVASEKQQPTEDDRKYAYCASQYIEKYKNLLNAKGSKSGSGSKGRGRGKAGTGGAKSGAGTARKAPRGKKTSA